MASQLRATATVQSYCNGAPLHQCGATVQSFQDCYRSCTYNNWFQCNPHHCTKPAAKETSNAP